MGAGGPAANDRGRHDVTIDVVTVGLVAAGVLRIACLALHRPIYGYANNFDFYRLAQWYGIGEDGTHPLPPHPEAPLARYVLGGPRVLGNAYLSSELIFLWASISLSRTAAILTGADATIFDIRWMGGVQALVSIAVGIVVTSLFRQRSRPAGMVAAAAFALVLADPIATLFLNTLYADYSAVLFGFVAIAGLVLLNGQSEWSFRTLVPTAVALLGLGLSKVQNQALPALLVGTAAMLWGLGRCLTGRKMAALGGLTIVCTLAMAVQSREPGPGLPEAIRMANATDTWFGAVLPALSAPEAAVRRLGLPPGCARYVGRTWYDAGMQPPPCPEVATLSRMRAVALLLGEPNAAKRLWDRATTALRPTLVDGYGQVEGKPLSGLEAESGPQSVSMAQLTDALPLPTYRLLVFLMIALAPASLATAVDRRREGRRTHDIHLLAALLGATAVYALGTSVLGDGLVGLQHHALLFSLAVWPALASGMTSFFHATRRD